MVLKQGVQMTSSQHSFTKWPLIIRAIRITNNFYGASTMCQALWQPGQLAENQSSTIDGFHEGHLASWSIHRIHLLLLIVHFRWANLHFKDCSSICVFSLLLHLRLKKEERRSPRDKRKLYLWNRVGFQHIDPEATEIIPRCWWYRNQHKWSLSWKIP